MKHFTLLTILFLTLCGSTAVRAQAPKEGADAQKLFQQANGNSVLRNAMKQQPDAFLLDASFRAGALRTFDGRRRPVPGLRFHVGQQALEAQDSLDDKITRLWPVGALRGFDIGSEDTIPRRFRPRLVKGGVGSAKREFVEVLTTLDGGPLVLAWAYSPAVAGSAQTGLQQMLVAGPGYAGSEALRPLPLNQADVLELFGKRNGEIRSFAAGERLHYDKATDVARMVDYFNRVAVAKW